ncbi:arsenate reductase/protein-tyrosine-phosphatase family protein [Alicyclobacillus cycloheptanicus]|jgi:arsenate reductase
MAEGWARFLAGNQVEVYSAGIEAHGLNPRAVAAMRDAGVDISHHTSDIIDLDRLNNADYVITLCGDANDKCPVTPPHVRRLHWGIEDPAKVTGSEEAVTAKFHEVRDTIKERVVQFLNEALDLRV